MTRRLLNLLTALSLLLCVAVCVLWVLSPWCGVGINVTTRADVLSLSAERGHLMVGCAKTEAWSKLAVAADARPPRNDAPPMAQELALFDAIGYVRWRVGGVAFLAFGDKPPPNQRYRLVVPMWLPCMLLSVLPLWRLAVRRRERQRSGAGLCPHCGYDLRATPGRCPECGTTMGGRPV